MQKSRDLTLLGANTMTSADFVSYSSISHNFKTMFISFFSNLCAASPALYDVQYTGRVLVDVNTMQDFLMLLWPRWQPHKDWSLFIIPMNLSPHSSSLQSILISFFQSRALCGVCSISTLIVCSTGVCWYYISLQSTGLTSYAISNHVIRSGSKIHIGRSVPKSILTLLCSRSGFFEMFVTYIRKDLFMRIAYKPRAVIKLCVGLDVFICSIVIRTHLDIKTTDGESVSAVIAMSLATWIPSCFSCLPTETSCDSIDVSLTSVPDPISSGGVKGSGANLCSTAVIPPMHS